MSKVLYIISISINSDLRLFAQIHDFAVPVAFPAVSDT
jgi:hypothetical protein